MFVRNALNSLLYRIRLYIYRRTIPLKVNRMRNNPKIKVLFVVSDVSIWKTESLYCEMLRHPRFEPILGVALLTADKPSGAIYKYQTLISYLSKKCYKYIEIFGDDIKEKIKPNIIFYQQPYEKVIDVNLFFRNNIESLFCYVNYAFNSIGQEWVGASSFLHYCWQTYYENSITMNYYDSVLPVISRNNAYVTGLPFQDILEKDKSEFYDPWKQQDCKKKRIIWAPHHTIPSSPSQLEYSTFLECADIMLEIAESYKEEVQFAFKPHPFLLKKLYNYWGKEKTDAYYQKWIRMENTQFESGEYYGLFKHSDALIHDCGSFTIEYLYMRNPVMYLSNGRSHTDTLNCFGKAAYDIHIIGKSKEDILRFIHDVISEEDCKKKEREQFVEKYLKIPKTGNASFNIINCILGEN